MGEAIVCRGLMCKMVVDGYHVRAGYNKVHGRWPGIDDIAAIIDNIQTEIGFILYEKAGLEFEAWDVVYCDAILSEADEAEIHRIRDNNGIDLEYDLSRYVEARARLVAKSTEGAPINTIINDLEVGRGRWAKLPPRQTGVDIVIATEMMGAMTEGSGMVLILSKDSGFTYAVHKLKSLGFKGSIANISYHPNGHSAKLREACCASFVADAEGRIELCEGDVSNIPSQTITLNVGA